jgi:hypothetical protein
MDRRAPFRVVRDEPGAPLRRTGRRVDAVGESRYQDALTELAGGKRRDSQYIATNAELWREPENPHDPNAIQVRIGGRVVGYLPRLEAERLAAAMDAAGERVLACPAEIRGGWRQGRDEGHFGVVVWLPRAKMR